MQEAERPTDHKRRGGLSATVCPAVGGAPLSAAQLQRRDEPSLARNPSGAKLGRWYQHAFMHARHDVERVAGVNARLQSRVLVAPTGNSATPSAMGCGLGAPVMACRQAR